MYFIFMKTKQIAMFLEEDLLNQVDDYAKNVLKENRSVVIRMAIRTFLKEKTKMKQ